MVPLQLLLKVIRSSSIITCRQVPAGQAIQFFIPKNSTGQDVSIPERYADINIWRSN